MIWGGFVVGVCGREGGGRGWRGRGIEVGEGMKEGRGNKGARSGRGR